MEESQLLMAKRSIGKPSFKTLMNVLVGLVALIYLPSCSSDMKDKLKSLKGEIVLQKEVADPLIQKVEARKETKKKIYSLPFAKVVDSDDNVLYSFYGDERVIYRGDHTAAWRDRMVDSSSTCLPLKIEDIDAFLELAESE